MGCCGGDMSGITGWFRSLEIYGYLLIGVFIVIAAYFIIVYQAHLAAYSSIIFIVIFFGLHMVMCGMGHGGHGRKDGGSCGGSHGEDQNKGPGKEAGTGNGDDKGDEKKGGSCH